MEKRVVVGRKTAQVKRERAKQLCREMTAEETRLWQWLRGNRLCGLHFRRQQVIEGFIVDFYCHAACLVVEVDGEIHQTQQDYDYERDCLFETHGLRVLRVRNVDVLEDVEAVLARIVEACRNS